MCIALTEIFDRYVSSMFLYKLYRFGYHAQKALGGPSSKHFMINRWRIFRPDPGYSLFKRTFFLASLPYS